MAQAQKTRRPFPAFYLIWGIIVLLLVAAACLVLRDVYLRLVDFEDAQPKYVAEEVFSTFSDRDFSTVYEWAGRPQADELSQEDYLTFLQRAVADPITCTEVYTPADNEQKYIVYGNGQKFASFTIQTNGDQSRYGFDRWAFSGAELYPEVTSSTYEILTDEQAMVYVNGQLLGEDKIIDRVTEAEANWLDSSQTIERTRLRYACSVYDLSDEEPDVRVQLPDGTAYPVEQNGDHAYQALLLYDESLKEAHASVAILLAERYAEFMSGNRSKKSALNYCAQGSPVYAGIEEYDTRWFASSVAHRFAHETAEKFIPLNSEAFSCEVSFVFYMKNKKGKSRSYPTAYRLYIIMSEGKWRLYNVELLSTDS